MWRRFLHEPSRLEPWLQKPQAQDKEARWRGAGGGARNLSRLNSVDYPPPPQICPSLAWEDPAAQRGLRVPRQAVESLGCFLEPGLSWLLPPAAREAGEAAEQEGCPQARSPPARSPPRPRGPAPQDGAWAPELGRRHVASFPGKGGVSLSLPQARFSVELERAARSDIASLRGRCVSETGQHMSAAGVFPRDGTARDSGRGSARG